MNKTHLQEICHSRHWAPPIYATAREGPDHIPSFRATVSVNGVVYASPGFSRSAKGAQDKAAEAAIELLSSAPARPPAVPLAVHRSLAAALAPEQLPSTASSRIRVAHEQFSSAARPPAEVVLRPLAPDADHEQLSDEALSPATSTARSPNSTPLPHLSSDDRPLYKNRLQNYLQRQSKSLPRYHSIQDGPSTRRFRATVEADGRTFESECYFPTIKEAQQSAAKVALMSLSPEGNQQECPVFSKNLLQQLAQKNGVPLPKYTTTSCGEGPSLGFLSSVHIEGKHFHGGIAKTKKLAEMNAAQVALSHLKEYVHALSLHFSEPLSEHQTTNQLNKVIDTDNSHHHSIIPTDMNDPDITVNKNDTVSIIQKPETVYVLNNEDTPQDAISEDDNSVDFSDSDCSELDSKAAPTELSTSIRDSLLLCKRVKVYPRKSDLVLPEGAVALPCSDDNWVAVEVHF